MKGFTNKTQITSKHNKQNHVEQSKKNNTLEMAQDRKTKKKERVLVSV